MPAPLPRVIVIGAMKCATSAVHAYLDAHPDVAMARGKEVNFFNGPEQAPADDTGEWRPGGHWHRGPAWYAAQFDATAPVCGESSPGYTSPSFPEVPARMAGLVPDARLVYLVRDPFTRAVSQYAHHRREGGERRPAAQALLDPDSQYLARSSYHARLAPFLAHFDAAQILTLVQERLLTDRASEVRRLYAHVGVDPTWHGPALDRRVHVGRTPVQVPGRVEAEFRRRTADDVARLRRLLDDDLGEWER